MSTTKYYVHCGELKKIVIAKNPYQAAEKSISLATGETLSLYFYVDEKGFRGFQNDITPLTTVIDTNFIPEYIIPYSDIVNELA